MKLNDMLTKQEIAAKFEVTVYTIDNYMRKGMPKTKLKNGRVLFIYEDCEKWLRGEE